MPSTRLSSLRAKIASLTSRSRPTTPESATALGTTPGNAVFDTPPQGSQPTELERSQRLRRSTSRGIAWAETRSKSKTRSNRNQRSRSRNADKASQASNTNESRGRSTTTRALGPSPNPHLNPNASNDEDGSVEARSQDSRRDGSIGSEEETDEVPESVFDRNEFARQLAQVVNQDVSEIQTQDIDNALGLLRANQTATMEIEDGDSSIILLPSAPLGVGGGYHRNHPSRTASVQSLPPQSRKRGSIPSESSASKRQRLTVPEDDSVTEPETDDDLIQQPIPRQLTLTPPPFITPFSPQPSPQPSPESPAQPRTQTTVLETQPDFTSPAAPYISEPSSHSLGGSRSHYGPNPSLPPLRGPTHARLRAKIQNRERARTQDADTSNLPSHGACTQSQTSSPPSPNPASQPVTQSDAQPGVRTYRGSRSHRGSDSQASARNETQPRSQRSTQSQADNRLEPSARSQPDVRARPDTRTQSQTASRSGVRAQPSDGPRPSTRVHAARPSAYQKPAPRPQPRSGLKHRDPVSQARADMVAFSREQAREGHNSLINNVSRHAERMRDEAEIERLSPRLGHQLLPDDEELRATAEAIAHGGHIGGRKPKPRASDSNGIPRQVLTLAKPHLFALSLVEGVYQTRSTFLHWASLVHEETWKMEVPDLPYIAPTDGELQVMVNNLATLRGKVKEQIRDTIWYGYGFRRRAVSQEDIRYNQHLYALIHPNNFHCSTFSPRVGHYENEELFHALAVALFRGRNSVGVLFHQYFDKISLETMAFILAIMQFCIEEWSSGWFESKDLNVGNMLEKYEAHMTGLKEARTAAPVRMARFQRDEYSGASTSRETRTQEVTRRSEVRPDTPPVEFDEQGRLTARSKGKGPTHN